MRFLESGFLIRRVRHLFALGLTGALLAACGGGDSGGGGSGSGVVLNSWGKDSSAFFQGTGTRGGNAGSGGAGANGGAGDGAPIRLADVTITDSTTPTAQSVTVKTDIDGYYQANITGFKPPLIAKVSYVDATGATVTRYSPSVATLKTNGFITINITGLTTYLTSQVAKASGGSGADDLTPDKLDASKLTTELANLRTFLLAASLPSALQTDIKKDYGSDLSGFNPISITYIPSVASSYDRILENVSATTPTATATALVVKTPLELAKSMFAELRTTWGTTLSPAAATINDFLYKQTTSTSADVNAAVVPNTTKVQSRFQELMKAMQFMDDAQGYATNANGLTVGAVPFGGDASGNGLIRTSGYVSSVWAGTGGYLYCWSDSATGVTTYTRCFGANSTSADIPNNRIKGILFELTRTAANQYSFSSYRYNWAVTGGGTATTGVPNKVANDGATPTPNPMPSGSGTVSKTVSGSTITGLTVDGSFPPSANPGNTLISGVDTVKVSATRTALSTANNYRYALTGSISTASLADSTKTVTGSFDSGSYIDTDETNAATSGAKAIYVKIIGTTKTPATQFTGTFELSSPANDAGGVYTPTHVVFDGYITNLSDTTVGKFLTGKMDLTVNNVGSFNSLLPDSSTNYLHSVTTFTGTLQAPSRPLMSVTTTITRTGMSTSDATMKYSYGLDVEVKGTTTVDTASTNKPVLTLTNQNGVQIVLDTTAYTGPVTVPAISGTTVWGNIGAGVVHYSDGTTESFN